MIFVMMVVMIGRRFVVAVVVVEVSVVVGWG